MERVCEQCGAGFEVPRSAVARGGGRFCSNACNGASLRASVACTCKQCGKGFEVPPSEAARGGGRFCSKVCSGAICRTSVACTCKQCGKGFEAKPSQVAKGWGRFCSKVCSDVGRTTRYRLFGGQVVTTAEIAELIGKSRSTVHARLEGGWMGATKLTSETGDDSTRGKADEHTK